jgi:hypothetical protein
MEQCAFLVSPRSQRSSRASLGLPRKAVPYADLEKLAPGIREALSTGELVLVPDGIPYGNKEFLVLDDAVVSIGGLWDLPMVGGEALDVEHRYQRETGGPSVTLSILEGAFVERDNVVCQIQNNFDDDDSSDRLERRILKEKLSKNQANKLRMQHKTLRRKLEERWKKNPSSRYYPAGGLPADAVFVVRTASLRAFEQSVLDNPPSQNDKPLGRREETTLLNIAGGLLGLLLGQSPGGKPHSVFKSQAAIIDALLGTYPGRPGMSKRTLEEKLALARRSLDT